MVTPCANRIIAIVLAAGRSTRMGEVNKLLKEWQCRPLVQHVLTATGDAENLADVVVVTGHQPDRVEAALGDGVTTVHNPEYASGMASSLRAGIAEAERLNADGALILLGDMPLVTAAHIEALIAAKLAATASATAGMSDTIIQATCNGKPGNPVLLPKSLFDEVKQIIGDRGARSIIERHSASVVPVELGVAAARDFDTPEAFALAASTELGQI